MSVRSVHNARKRRNIEQFYRYVRSRRRGIARFWSFFFVLLLLLLISFHAQVHREAKPCHYGFNKFNIDCDSNNACTYLGEGMTGMRELRCSCSTASFHFMVTTPTTFMNSLTFHIKMDHDHIAKWILMLSVINNIRAAAVPDYLGRVKWYGRNPLNLDQGQVRTKWKSLWEISTHVRATDSIVTKSGHKNAIKFSHI